MVERGGEVRVKHLHDVTAKNLRDVLVRNANRVSRLHTDESRLYPAVGVSRRKSSVSVASSDMSESPNQSQEPTANETRAFNFAMVLGIATIAWQGVEVALFDVFGRLMKGADQEVVSAAFHSTVNFGIKLAATDAAAQQALRDLSLYQEWLHLRSRLHKRSNIRNRIVHYHLYIDEDNKDVARRVFLAPNWIDARTENMFDRNHRNSKNIYQKELMEITLSFKQLESDMKEFKIKLPPLPKRRVLYLSPKQRSVLSHKE